MGEIIGWGILGARSLVSRLAFFFFVGLVFLVGFFFNLRNEQSIVVDYIVGSGSFRVSWIVLISMLSGVATALVFLFPFYLRNILNIKRLNKRIKKSSLQSPSMK